MNGNCVKCILAQYRELRAMMTLQTTLSLRSSPDDIPPMLKKQIALIEAWLSLLNDEEWFTVTKHLVDDLPWPLVVTEYEKRWGQMDSKSERTLKRFQARAINKIVAFVEKNDHESLVHSLFMHCNTPIRSNVKFDPSLSLLCNREVL